MLYIQESTLEVSRQLSVMRGFMLDDMDSRIFIDNNMFF